MKINPLFDYLKNVWGLCNTPAIYKQAFTHKSYDQTKNNERLEFIGDEVLGLIITEYIFNRFPEKDEGALSRLRSRLVSRKCLNQLGEATGMREYIVCEKSLEENVDILGNTVEALIGAMYFEVGFNKTKKCVLSLMQKYLSWEELIREQKNPKSELLEWAQKNEIKLAFILLGEKTEDHGVSYEIALEINGKNVLINKGKTKKEVEFSLAKDFLARI